MKLFYQFTKGNKLWDGRDVPPIGEWMEHNGPLCESGLRASVHPFDAMCKGPFDALEDTPSDALEDPTFDDWDNETICIGGTPFHSNYTPGPTGTTLHMVELDGEIIEDDDVVVGRRWKIIVTIEAKPLLREFAR